MKKLIATIAMLATTAALASTSVVWVRGTSASQVEREMRNRVSQINRGTYRVSGCDNAKVYAASDVKKSYRTNRFGELEVQYTATIKVRCSNRD
jgi:hypothetical protein